MDHLDRVRCAVEGRPWQPGWHQTWITTMWLHGYVVVTVTAAAAATTDINIGVTLAATTDINIGDTAAATTAARMGRET
jgi:hypothetical protein